MMLSVLQSVANHLWQSTLFALAAGLVTLILRRNRAQVRYMVWLAASAKFLIPFSPLILLGSRWGSSGKPAIITPNFSYIVVQASQPFWSAAPAPHSAPSPILWMGWIPVAIFASWMIGAIGILYSWRRRGMALRAAMRTASEIELNIGVKTLTSPAFSEPAVFGVWQPVLLLPTETTGRLSSSQFKAVVAHELCHIRRRDNLWAALHMGFEVLFWFYPLVWWLGARLEEERERACDEQVLLEGNPAEEYAEGILRICEMCVESVMPCVARVTTGNLRKRIQLILWHRTIELTVAKKVALAVAGVAAFIGPVIFGVVVSPSAIHAQATSSASIPRFEVVSVKTCKDGPANIRGPRNESPGLLRIPCVVLADENGAGLIQRAYVRFSGGHVNPWGLVPISGGPAWIHSEYFDISARAEGSPSAEMMQGPMLQAVLEDRFKLKIRREVATGSVYDLTLTRKGSKLASFQAGTCVELPLTSARPELPAGQRYCRSFVGPRQINAEGVTLSEFATLLNLAVGRPVIDKTGLNGRFNIHLEFEPDEVTPGVRGPIHDATAEPVGGKGPTIFTAVQEQLGLTLTGAKGPVEVLKIDHVERPSEN